MKAQRYQIQMLDLLQKTLDQTSRLLSSTKDELKQAYYNIKEKDFIISKQIKSGKHWLYNLHNFKFIATFSNDGCKKCSTHCPLVCNFPYLRTYHRHANTEKFHPVLAL